MSSPLIDFYGEFSAESKARALLVFNSLFWLLIDLFEAWLLWMCPVLQFLKMQNLIV
jgi:hypothetical protein